MKRLLVTGISGFLGNCLAGLDQQDWQIYGLYHSNAIEHPAIKTFQINLTQQTDLENIFNTIQPDAVLHLAALSNANFVEVNQAVSEIVNVKVTIDLVELSKSRGIPFVFASSDLVFGGKNAPYDEEARLDPVSIYGQQKVQAEKEIVERYPDAIIARCPVMYGMPKWGNTFMKSWVNNLKEGKNVYAFTDEFRTKVSGNTAIKGMLLLLQKYKKGIWHLGGTERMSRYDFAIKMADAFELPKDLVKASLQADVQMAAARPADVSLDSSKAIAIGYEPPLIHEELLRLKN